MSGLGLDPRRYRPPQLVHGDAFNVLPRLVPGSVGLVVLDPPWMYSAGSPNHGSAGAHYSGLSYAQIWTSLELCYAAAAPDTYAVVWCTWPTIFEWWSCGSSSWVPCSGGSWHKKTNRPGLGYHWRGKSEPIVLLRKGRPKPLSRGVLANAFDEPLQRHSIKPVAILERVISRFAAPGSVVLDPFAGYASAGVAATIANRRYLGIEKKEERAIAASANLRFALAITSRNAT